MARNRRDNPYKRSLLRGGDEKSMAHEGNKNLPGNKTNRNPLESDEGTVKCHGFMVAVHTNAHNGEVLTRAIKKVITSHLISIKNVEVDYLGLIEEYDDDN